MANENFIHFPLNGEPEVMGSLQSPGKFGISYDPYRMEGYYLSTARGARDGMIFMYVAFNGTKDAKEVEMLSRTNASGVLGGGPVIDLTPITHKMEIPPGVWEIQIWFKGMARSSMGWDSNYGNNYRFEVNLADPHFWTTD